MAAAPPAVAAPARYFSPWVTAVYAVLTVLLVVFFYYSWGSPLGNLQRPEESLERLVSREMDLDQSFERLPRWERRLYELTGSDPESFDDAIGRFDEFDEEERSARTDLDLVVLLGEAGLLERVGSLIESLEGTDTAAQYGRWLEAAYLDAPPPEEAVAMAEEIRRELPRDWFTDTLVRRIATRIDDAALEADAEAAIEARGQSLLMRVRMLTITGGALLAVSAVVLWRLLRARHAARVAAAPLPPPWGVADGLGLFFRSAFAYLLIPAVVVVLLPRTAAGTAIMGLVGGLPMLWWARRYLHSRGETVGGTFGLRLDGPGAGRRLAAWALVLVAISIVGESLLSVALSALGITSHWADGFLEEFLWGSPATVAAGTLDGVVWAPIFEELVFRGLLFPSLRLRLPGWSAALLSAAIFGVAHGYGVQGFAAVTWSGMIWALGYQRTRSLLPGIVAHAASNLLATASFLLLLRL